MEIMRKHYRSQFLWDTRYVSLRDVVGNQDDDDGDSDCSSGNSSGHRTELKSLAAAYSRDRSPSNQSSPGSSSAEEAKVPSDAYRYQRRRSRAVLYQLSGTYRKKRSTASKLQLHKVAYSSACIVDVTIEQFADKSFVIVNSRTNWTTRG